MPAFAIAARSRASRASKRGDRQLLGVPSHQSAAHEFRLFPYAGTLNSSRAVPVSTSQPSLVTATPSPSTM